MSGHSKWATTKNKKAAIDAKRSSLFTKYAKNVAIAAKKGGDPETNFSLRLAIDKAKAINMPKDNIERAIKRGTGEDGGANYEEVMYEIYGPDGAPMLVEAVTDNKNRTTSEIKAILNKHGGTLASQNAVKWMFEHKGVIHLTPEQIGNKDEMTLELIDWGADDVVEEDRGLTLYCPFENFEKIKKALEAKGLSLSYAEPEWVAKDKLEANAELAEKISQLVEIIEENEDVNNVYTNLK